MKSLWSDTEAAQFPGELGQRVYSSRLLGREKSLVLHGGGNTSVKITEKNLLGEDETLLYVKGSGWDLEFIEAAGFSPVRIDHLIRMEDRRDRGELAVLIKKEAGKILEEIEKMNRYFGGIKNMRRLPGAIFIVDPPMERIAVTEAIRMRIPIIAMCDTNSNPDEIDFPIPANDDAIRAVRLIASKIADAAIEGRSLQGYASEADDTSDLDMTSIAGTFSASPDDPEPATTQAEVEGPGGEQMAAPGAL